MRILMTGATGFIGVHLATRLCQFHEVAALMRPQARIERLAEVIPLQHLIWDEEPSSLPSLLSDFRPEIIIHLASYFVGAHQQRDVETLIASNIRYPTVLLDAAIEVGCYQFLNMGSIAQHALNADYAPTGLYGATKQAFADILTYYVQSGGLKRVLTLELSYAYGPNDPVDRLIQYLSRASSKNETLAMSPGEQFLDFVHVDDVVAGYMRALGLLSVIPNNQQRTYALRSGHPIKLNDFVALYNEVSPKPVKVDWGARTYRPREFMQPWTQGEVLPGWSPKISLRDGLCELLKS